MKKDILFTVSSYFRDDMNIMAKKPAPSSVRCAATRCSSCMSAHGWFPSCARSKRRAAFSPEKA